MRIGIFHNRYRQRGGEDAAVDLDVELLRKAGHEVHVFTLDSAAIAGWRAHLSTAVAARGSHAVATRCAEFLSRHPIDLGHVHNFFPVLTPAVHQVLFDLGIPVVQTLHNYRLACARGDFLRAGRHCEDCLGRGPWNAVLHGCYRGSRLATAVWADATAYHRRRGTWDALVDRFVAPSRVARAKLVAAGLPAERIAVRPHAVPDPGEPAPPGRGAVFVGRLASEKGAALLLEAWQRLPDVPLTLVGSGPEEARLRQRARDLPQVRFTGALPPEGVRAELARAAFGVAPSLCLETFGLAAAEMLAAGRPVVVPRDGALAELVDDGLSGRHFPTGDASALAEACAGLALEHEVLAEMSREARERYLERLAPERSLERLLAIYAEAEG